jgi:hypothetical protein
MDGPVLPSTVWSAASGVCVRDLGLPSAAGCRSMPGFSEAIANAPPPAAYRGPESPGRPPPRDPRRSPVPPPGHKIITPDWDSDVVKAINNESGADNRSLYVVLARLLAAYLGGCPDTDVPGMIAARVDLGFDEFVAAGTGRGLSERDRRDRRNEIRTLRGGL